MPGLPALGVGDRQPLRKDRQLAVFRRAQNPGKWFGIMQQAATETPMRSYAWARPHSSAW